MTYVSNLTSNKNRYVLVSVEIRKMPYTLFGFFLIFIDFRHIFYYNGFHFYNSIFKSKIQIFK